ncbi:2Fe-2S iron-sulfur cluster-binding protein [Duganella sp. BuS-21]|uniref:PDR/VanB family oxidoreductase n=1 Tax=Duganella sp. BuS-21 TaxID=2943848 RepID=UPI0035A64BEB
MDVVIQSIRDSGDVRLLELAAVDGTPLPPYEAGAHIDVTLGNGLVRQYSLCCRAPSAAYRLAVKREPQSRGGSAWLHEVAHVGTRLGLGQPRNAFALTPAAGHYLLFAGGIGITPILSMAYALLRRGASFQLMYFVRDTAGMAFADELQSGPLASQVVMHAGQDAAQVAASLAAAMGAAPADGTQVYVCGPAPFMSAVTAAGSARFGAAAVHQESFSPAAIDSDKEAAFVLRLARSQRELPVSAGQSALACLQDAGIDIDCSCEVGVCGTCRTGVLAGVPDHRDAFLSASERQANDCFMPCVSRARTAVLVLDL